MARIVFEIDEEGNVVVEVSGVRDSSCRNITAAVERALGVKVRSRSKPQEFVELDQITIREN